MQVLDYDQDVSYQPYQPGLYSESTDKGAGDCMGVGGFNEPASMFNLMSTIFPIFIVLFIAVFIFVIIKGIMQWNYNNQQPVLTVEAKVTDKRTEVSNSHHADHHSHYSTHYYATFEVESGDRMEFHVKKSDYGLLAAGDRGKLTFQGTRFYEFERYHVR
ncbi:MULTISPECIES: DUF2500 domain-containing protein [Paenibacillus]|uniref:DUF2500 domain-containing protein n=2 Tax=Paenibacillus TaxID=44249 RepID=A0ABT4EG38_PAEAL|nr:MULTISPECIES: DUF2500 domain-containing protein [Paenibacillus]MCY9532712.1 DUF2500 domain-containing protein [Paenibacillus alvei]SDE63851.1 Protein of unknown function [Paenibacillus sp. cl6col]